MEKVDGTIGGTGEAMPERPPAAGRVREGQVIWVLAEEMAVILACSCKVSRGRVKNARCQIDGNQIPSRAKSASNAVRDKEQAVGRGGDGSKKCYTGGGRGKESRVVVGMDRKGSGDGKRRGREGKRECNGASRGGLGDVTEFEQRGMVGSKRFGKPNIIIHLNVERGVKRMR
jgi:hypothetical protein